MAGTKAVSDQLARQLATCQRFRVGPVVPVTGQTVGLSRNARGPTVWPLNGLRHSPVGGTSGWYVWAGEEFDMRPDFFQPVHIEHLWTLCPLVLPYLALPPGWRFLIAPNQEDVWQDLSLLRT